MAKLQFLDTDNEIKDIANIDSPSFTGEGTTVNPIDANNTQIINLRYIKKVLDKSLSTFNTDTIEMNSSTINELVPGSDYLVNLYGVNTINCNPDFPYNPVYTSSYPDNYVYTHVTTKGFNKIYVNMGEEPLPPGYVKIGYFAILNKANQVIGKSDIKPKPFKWPNNNASIPDSATIRITAPVDGIIYGYLNYGMNFGTPIPVKYMNAIRLNDVKINTFKALIMQQTNQTVIVTVNGVDYKENFSALPGSSFTARSEGYPGYKGGVVSPSSGTFDRDIIFTVGAATPTTYTATITQKPHQTITVTYNGNNYTSTISNIPLNSVLLARITHVDYGYNAGKISPSNTIKIKSDIDIVATDVKPLPYLITVSQKENEIVRVTYNDRTYTENFQANYLSRIKVVVESLDIDSYLPGDILISGNYGPTEQDDEFIINGEVTVTAYTARRNEFTISLPATVNQTIVFTYKLKISGGYSLEQEIRSSETEVTQLVVTLGTIWNATVEAGEGYIPGELSENAGVIESNIELSVTEAMPEE